MKTEADRDRQLYILGGLFFIIVLYLMVMGFSLLNSSELQGAPVTPALSSTMTR